MSRITTAQEARLAVPVNKIRLSHTADIPIFKQIADQIRLMIETGQLVDGDRLPSSRLLAANLRINRNTVARAYRELRDSNLVESRRRNGMVVANSARARDAAAARQRARAVMASATQKCISLGLSPDDVSSLAFHCAMHARQGQLRVSFVECNEERAGYFAAELSEILGLPVQPLVLEDLDPNDRDEDLVLTTFFHLVEVRRLLRGTGCELVAIVVAPHVRTLVQLAEVPPERRVGVLYSTEQQGHRVKDSLVEAGLENVEVIATTGADDLEGVDIVVVPTEMPSLRRELEDRVEVIEYGNVLDEASIQMVSAVVEELRDAKSGDGLAETGMVEDAQSQGAPAPG